MARSIRAKSPAKRTRKTEKYIIVELDSDGDAESIFSRSSFKTQQAAESYAYESEPDCQLAICKVVSVSNIPEPQPPQLIFKPY